MAWLDISINHITFGLFEPNPANATVSVAPPDSCRVATKMVPTR